MAKSVPNPKQNYEKYDVEGGSPRHRISHSFVEDLVQIGILCHLTVTIFHTDAGDIFACIHLFR